MTTENEIKPAATDECLDGGRCAVDALLAEASHSRMTPQKAMQLAEDFCKHEAWGLDFWREPMTVLAAEVVKLTKERAAHLEAIQYTVSVDKILRPDERHTRLEELLSLANDQAQTRGGRGQARSLTSARVVSTNLLASFLWKPTNQSSTR